MRLARPGSRPSTGGPLAARHRSNICHFEERSNEESDPEILRFAQDDSDQRAEKWDDSRDRTLAGRARSWLRLLVILLVTSPLFASEKARTFRVRVGGDSVRVIVPKTFEPLLPGSVYPNRRKPVEARRLPVAILSREAAPALEFLLERRLLVVEHRDEPLDALLEALAARPEADRERAALLVFRSAPPALPAAVKAVAVFDPDLDAPRAAGPSPVALFFRAPGLVPSEELSRASGALFGPHVVEKWYRGEAGFPVEAFRDAADWAAAMLSR